MKKRLNILCVIILLVMGYSVVEAGYYLTMGAWIGAKTGYEHARQLDEAGSPVDSVMAARQISRMTNMEAISLVPRAMKGEDTSLFLDSVYNVKSKAYVPVVYGAVVVSVEKPENVFYSAVSGLTGILAAVSTVWALILFIRLIVAINRSDIFNWRNVRRLRRLGILLLVVYGCSFLLAYLTCIRVEEVFAMDGYDLSLSDMCSTTSLLLGLCALIVGEVFAIGLRMKEEQDLTI